MHFLDFGARLLFVRYKLAQERGACSTFLPLCLQLGACPELVVGSQTPVATAALEEFLHAAKFVSVAWSDPWNCSLALVLGTGALPALRLKQKTNNS